MSKNADTVDALDHIMRVANASRTQTRRLRWIAARCADALGLGGDWREIDLPKNRDYVVNRNQRLGLENAKLRGEIQSLQAEIAENKKHKELLGEAIGKIAIAGGIIDGSIPLTGPQVLMIADDCAEMIAALKPQWISVEDRLPEDGQRVFYYFEHTGISWGQYDEEFNTFYGGRGFLTGDVTHWLPFDLSSPPPEAE